MIMMAIYSGGRRCSDLINVITTITIIINNNNNILNHLEICFERCKTPVPCSPSFLSYCPNYSEQKRTNTSEVPLPGIRIDKSPNATSWANLQTYRFFCSVHYGFFFHIITIIIPVVVIILLFHLLAAVVTITVVVVVTITIIITVIITIYIPENCTKRKRRNKSSLWLLCRYRKKGQL